jgi:transposase-like protein
MATILLPIRNVKLEFGGLLAEMYQALSAGVLAAAGQWLNRQLEGIVTQELARDWHARRATVSGSSRFACQRCGTRWRRQFTRNGYRQRGLSLVVGTVRLALPRVVCACGGSVQLHLNGLRPRQRLGDDLGALVPHWAKLAYSLRAMKRELDAAVQSSVGLRSLNQRLQAVAAQVPAWYQRELIQVPPVVVLDGIWTTLLEPSGQVVTDRQGRRRAVKTRFRRPVLMALGVWPEEGRSAVLDWELGDQPGEDQASWLRLLNRLEQRGLRPQRGLRLFVHDGGPGLLAALRDLFWEVPHQRCIFHKLRNVWRAVSLPETQPPEAARAERRQLIRQAARIWQAPTRDEAVRRYHAVCHTWQATQPAAVLTLQRDFADTLTFYTLWEHHRLWNVRALRTTSWLERLNRTLRARLRKAGAFHSRAGLDALLVQVLGVF